jgi:hypothetical protein
MVIMMMVGFGAGRVSMSIVDCRCRSVGRDGMIMMMVQMPVMKAVE